MISLGIDIGTTSVCGVLFNDATGETLSTLTLGNGSTVAGAPCENLQDAGHIEEQARGLLARLRAGHEPVKAVGISTQMHGIVYVDAQGCAVGPLITWQDGRANLPYHGSTYARELSRLSGHEVYAGYGAATYFYDCLNGRVPAGAAGLCTIGDYLAMRLTGMRKPATHPSNAAGIGLFDIRGGAFDRQSIRRFGMDDTMFPTIFADCKPVGFMPDGVAVAPSIGDNQASFLGSVRDPEHSLLVNMGTGGQISFRVPEYATCASAETRPFLRGDYLLVGSSLCGGKAYALLENFFSRVFLMVGSKPDNIYELMNAAAAAALDDPHPLKVNTTFSGTRQDPTLPGSIERIGLDNLTPGQLALGVLQGTVDELYALFQSMARNTRFSPRMLVGSGNGLRKNTIWVKLFENTFRMPMRIPVHEEEAALGAALHASLCTNPAVTYDHLRRGIRYQAE